MANSIGGLERLVVSDRPNGGGWHLDVLTAAHHQAVSQNAPHPVVEGISEVLHTDPATSRNNSVEMQRRGKLVLGATIEGFDYTSLIGVVSIGFDPSRSARDAVSVWPWMLEPDYIDIDTFRPQAYPLAFREPHLHGATGKVNWSRLPILGETIVTDMSREEDDPLRSTRWDVLKDVLKIEGLGLGDRRHTAAAIGAILSLRERP